MNNIVYYLEDFLFHDVTVPGDNMYGVLDWEEEKKTNPDLPSFEEMFESWLRGDEEHWNWRFFPISLLYDPYKVDEFLHKRRYGDLADPA